MTFRTQRTWCNAVVFFVCISLSFIARAEEPPALSYKDVVAMTYQNNGEILAARQRLATQQALLQFEERDFARLTYGVRSTMGYEYSRTSPELVREATPRVEVFATKRFLKGQELSVSGGSEQVFSRHHEDEIGGFIGARIETPIRGSETLRNQQVRLLDKGGDVLLAESDYYVVLRDNIRKAVQTRGSAQVNRNMRLANDTFLRELAGLRAATSRVGDSDGIMRIEAALAEGRSDQEEIDSAFSATASNLRQRIGIAPNAPLVIQSGSIVVQFPQAEKLIEYAVINDPQIRSLQITRDTLRAQRVALGDGTFDISGIFESRANTRNYPQDYAYGLVVGLSVTFPDRAAHQSRVAALLSRLSEVELRIAKSHDEIANSVLYLYEQLNSYRKGIEGALSLKTEREQLYRKRLSEYEHGTMGSVRFEEMLSAFNSWMEEFTTADTQAAQYVIFLGELWEKSGYYFQILEHENLLTKKE